VLTEHDDVVAAMPVDGVGLLCAEFMLTEALGGEHPRRLVSQAHPEIAGGDGTVCTQNG
jgi:pyruvate, water dikinase